MVFDLGDSQLVVNGTLLRSPHCNHNDRYQTNNGQRAGVKADNIRGPTQWMTHGARQFDVAQSCR